MKNNSDKRERILKAAIQVFARRGFFKSRVAEIAKQAGVADGTIYLYFKNKDEILISIFEEEMDRFIAQIKQRIAEAEECGNKLKVFIQTHLHFVERNPKLAQVFQLELRQSNRFMKEYSGSKLREYLNILGSLIEAGQKDGTVRSDLDPALVKLALFGALDEIATHWVLSKNRKYNLNDSAEQIAAIFRHGILDRQLIS